MSLTAIRTLKSRFKAISFCLATVELHMRFVEKYIQFIKKYKVLIIVLWLIVLGFSIWLAPKFIGETSSDFNVPDDTPSAIANAVLKEEFPDIDTETTIVVVIYNSTGTSLCNETREFSYNLKASIFSSDYSTLVADVNGFYFMLDIGLPDAAYGYVSESTNSV